MSSGASLIGLWLTDISRRLVDQLEIENSFGSARKFTVLQCIQPPIMRGVAAFVFCLHPMDRRDFLSQILQCRVLFDAHCWRIEFAALFLWLGNCCSKSAARIPMMAMTTNSSTSVNAG